MHSKKESFPRDIRLMICKKMLPELNQLIEWCPQHYLPHFIKLYPHAQQEKCSELLIKRHIADLYYVLDMHNMKNQTPCEIAKSCIGRMGIFVPPVQLLNRNNIGDIKPIITRNYKKLLGISE